MVKRLPGVPAMVLFIMATVLLITGCSAVQNVIGGLTRAPALDTTKAVSPGSAYLQWHWSGRAELSGFEIQRKKDEGDTFSEVETTGPGVRSYQDTGLSENTSYEYRVRAIKDNGVTSDWAEGYVRTPDFAAPANLSATAQTSGIYLGWNTNHSTSDTTGITIERKTGSNPFEELVRLAPDAFEYTDGDVTSSTTYTYRIRVYHRVWGPSDWSNEASATAN